MECTKRVASASCVPGVLALLLMGGCAAARPHYFPPAPLRINPQPGGGYERLYDTTGDGRADYSEHLSSNGRATILRYDVDGDGILELEVDRTLPARGNVQDQRPFAEPPRLLIIADSVPFDMVRNAYVHGRFRLFHPPRRVISPFPVMTDLSLNELFGTSPATAVETEYFDGTRFRDGFGPYTREANSAWLTDVDYHLPYASHGDAYLDPLRRLDEELARIEHAVIHRAAGDVTAYVVGTSALGIQMGRDGHLAGLLRLDRFCQSLMHRLRGRLEITLLSDHGHSLVASRLLPLKQRLTHLGYRVRQVPKRPRDVVVPAFGLVSCAALYCPSPADVARDLVGAEGVELAAYRGGNGDVIVLSRDGRARVARSGQRLRYVADFGDPLQLAPILGDLAQRGLVDQENFVDDHALFRATTDHVYPDPLHRLHRAFGGLVEHTPDVLLSLADGWCWGSPFMAGFLTVCATHGSLNRDSSTGFVMSTAGALPPVTRMEDVADELQRVGAWPVIPSTADRGTADRSSTDRSE